VSINELGQGHCTAITEQLLPAAAGPSLAQSAGRLGGGTDTETALSGEVLTAAGITLARQRGLVQQQLERTGLSAPTAIEAVMIAGCWRKRHHALIDWDIDDVKEQLWRSGERFAHAFHATGPVARTRRRVVRTVVRRHLPRQAHAGDA
jgi:hypothetical protein